MPLYTNQTINENQVDIEWMHKSVTLRYELCDKTSKSLESNLTKKKILFDIIKKWWGRIPTVRYAYGNNGVEWRRLKCI